MYIATGRVWLLLMVVSVLMPLSGSATSSGARVGWFVSAELALERYRNKDLTVLDTRSAWDYGIGHWPGSVRVDWEAFTPSALAQRGTLVRDDARLRRKLRALGVSGGRPVFVVGEPLSGWGESARIVWMLRTLGQRQAAVVDGGWAALERAGAESTLLRRALSRGILLWSDRGYWLIVRDASRARLGEVELQLIDTREQHEYAGATPYGEARGGHLPGAVHLYYKALLREEGTLKSDEALRGLLARRGITPNELIVSYCSGGVRSTFVTAVLRHLGFPRARNYAGSTWEWAAAPAERFPLEKD